MSQCEETCWDKLKWFLKRSRGQPRTNVDVIMDDESKEKWIFHWDNGIIIGLVRIFDDQQIIYNTVKLHWYDDCFLFYHELYQKGAGFRQVITLNCFSIDDQFLLGSLEENTIPYDYRLTFGNQRKNVWENNKKFKIILPENIYSICSHCCHHEESNSDAKEDNNEKESPQNILLYFFRKIYNSITRRKSIEDDITTINVDIKNEMEKWILTWKGSEIISLVRELNDGSKLIYNEIEEKYQGSRGVVFYRELYDQGPGIREKLMMDVDIIFNHQLHGEINNNLQPYIYHLSSNKYRSDNRYFKIKSPFHEDIKN